MANEQLDAAFIKERDRHRHRRRRSAPGPEPGGTRCARGKGAGRVQAPAAKADKAKPEPEDDRRGCGVPLRTSLSKTARSYIPQQVLERESVNVAKDWKARAVEAETKHKELQRQPRRGHIAARRYRRRRSPRHSRSSRPPDPATDPRGFGQYLPLQQQAAARCFNGAG